jgi:hypothetical protein
MAPRISRQGLVECPTCKTHIRADEARCPFCGEARSELDRTMLAALKDLFGARGGAMATSLVSLGIAVGCSSTPVPLYGIAPLDSGAPAQDAAQEDAAGPDVTIGPLYGIAPVDGGQPEDAAVDAGPAPDIGIAPMYGLPPPDAAVVDTGTTPDANLKDATIGPLYGIAPVDGG